MKIEHSIGLHHPVVRILSRLFDLCVAVSCCVLLCVAVCCCVLLCVAVSCCVLLCVAVCCCVLQHDATLPCSENLKSTL